jgi:hypothetical protein
MLGIKDSPVLLLCFFWRVTTKTSLCRPVTTVPRGFIGLCYKNYNLYSNHDVTWVHFINGHVVYETTDRAVSTSAFCFRNDTVCRVSASRLRPFLLFLFRSSRTVKPWILIHFGRTSWTRYGSIARPLFARDNTTHKHVGFEPAIPEFGRFKTVLALARAEPLWSAWMLYFKIVCDVWSYG